MMNLFIGLCFGIASAVALIVMWRMAERLRRELQSAQDDPAEPELARRDDATKRPPASR